MQPKPGDLVEIVSVPTWIQGLGEPEQRVYRHCLGFVLVVLRVDEDGLCVFRLDQEWSHFPEIAPFELRFDAGCLRRIESFGDAEWEALSTWMARDTLLTGEVIEVDGWLKVRLEGGTVGDLVLSDGAATTDYLGKTIPVRIITLNRKKRVLVLFPQSGPDGS